MSKTWLKGLVVAVIGGAFANVGTAAADPTMYHGPAVGKRIAIVSGMGAILATAAYLKQSPIKK